jgi:large conductance mechanosensitive channel
MPGMLQEFKDFAMKGNVVDLAIGVVIGAAFGKIVASLVEDIIMPVLGIVGKADFSNYFVPLSSAVTATNLVDAKKQGGVFAYGNFITNVISFMIIAFALFLVVKLINATRKQEAKAPAAPPAPTTTEALLVEIRDALVKR